MYTSTVFVLLAAFAGVQAQGLTFLCPTATDEIRACDSKHLGSVSSPVSTVLTDPGKVFSGGAAGGERYFEALCNPGSRSAVKSYYSCLLTKLNDCVSESRRNFFPSTTSMLASIDYLCDNIKDVDVTCIVNTTYASQFVNCINSTVSGQKMDTLEEILEQTCRAFPSTKSCMLKVYESCPKRTAEVFANQMEMTKPQACGGACVYLPSFLLIISAIAMFLFKKE